MHVADQVPGPTTATLLAAVTLEFCCSYVAIASALLRSLVHNGLPRGKFAPHFVPPPMLT